MSITTNTKINKENTQENKTLKPLVLFLDADILFIVQDYNKEDKKAIIIMMIINKNRSWINI